MLTQRTLELLWKKKQIMEEDDYLQIPKGALKQILVLL